MMSRPLITELPARGPSRGGNHPKALRGPVGKERPAGPRSHIPESPCTQPRGSASGTCGGAARSNHYPTCRNFCQSRMTRNSQERWIDSCDGVRDVVVATGHRMISATGVHRVNKAIERSEGP